MSFQRMLHASGVDETLRRYPGLAITPGTVAVLTLTGTLAFTASAPALETITDSYEISISVRDGFPRRTPEVSDLGNRIAPDYHRLDDGSFCLGSPARLRLVLSQTPTLTAFIEKCVIPYLYGYSFFERHGRPPFGELTHGDRGIIEDYMQIFEVGSLPACIGMLGCIGMKRRVANKHPCPCGARLRLGRCSRSSVDRIARRAAFTRFVLGEGRNGMVRYVRNEVAEFEASRRARMG